MGIRISSGRFEYVTVDDPEIVEPSVITLNALSATPAVNDFMMLFTGLFEPSAKLSYLMNFARERSLERVRPVRDADCLDCSNANKSRRSRGDGLRLPCRMS